LLAPPPPALFSLRVKRWTLLTALQASPCFPACPLVPGSNPRTMTKNRCFFFSPPTLTTPACDVTPKLTTWSSPLTGQGRSAPAPPAFPGLAAPQVFRLISLFVRVRLEGLPELLPDIWLAHLLFSPTLLKLASSHLFYFFRARLPHYDHCYKTQSRPQAFLLPYDPRSH